MKNESVFLKIFPLINFKSQTQSLKSDCYLKSCHSKLFKTIRVDNSGFDTKSQSPPHSTQPAVRDLSILPWYCLPLHCIAVATPLLRIRPCFPVPPDPVPCLRKSVSGSSDCLNGAGARSWLCTHIPVSSFLKTIPQISVRVYHILK